MRNTNLDGLRGLAALAVVIAHCELHYGGLPAWHLKLSDFPTQPISAILGRLWFTVFPSDPAVVVFFVLSGYVLSLSLGRAGRSPRKALLPYVVQRLFRLLPSGFVAGLILLCLVPMNLRTAIGTMFLFDSSINGPIWTLRIEWIGFLVVFAVWAINRLFFSIAVIAAFEAVVIAWPEPVLPYMPYFILMPAFVLGTLIPRVPTGFWERRATLWCSLALLLLPDIYFGKLSPLMQAIECLSAFGLVGCLATRGSDVLNSKVAQFLGSISYPMYLCGIPAMIAVSPLIDRFCGTSNLIGPDVFAFANIPQPYMIARSALLATFTSTIAILAGWVIHYLVEIPGIRAGRVAIEALLARARQPSLR